MELNPLASYRGVGKRFFLLYKHVLGMISGAVIARATSLPEYKRKYLRSPGKRLIATLLKPFVKKKFRTQPVQVQLRLRLESLGPTYIKLGQIMAIREDILPQEVTDELKQLLDRLPEVPFEIILDIIERSLGAPADENFIQIDQHAIGSASIGQTHVATLKTGERVVLKVIKPGIRDTILSDIRLLKILARFLEWLVPRFQPQVIINEFCLYTEKEVDLTYEADHAELFAANFADNPDVHFPKIYRELSSADVLCMEYLEGIKPNDSKAREMNPEDVQKVIDVGSGAIIKMLYDDGFFHADLHAGNLIILPGPRVGFIDLGMVGRFDEKTKRAMLYYFYSLVNGDIEGSAKYLLMMAKVGPGGDPAGFRRSVSDLFRRYLLHAKHGEFSLAQLILESLAIGGDHRIFFPVEMTLMVKALVTFEGVGQALDPNLDVPELSKKHISTIYSSRYSPEYLVKQIMSGVPELVDVLIALPKLVSDGSRSLDHFLNDNQPENPLAGLKSSLLTGASLVAGVIAFVQDSDPFLWITMFVLSGLFFLFGK